MDARAGLGFATVQRHLLVGFGSSLPAVSQGLEASQGGVWRLPFLSLCQRVLGWQIDSLGTGTLLVSNSGDWMSQSEEQHVCPLLGMWAGGCCASGTTGELTEPPECLQLLPGALPRCCCSHWGEASPEGNASRLLACQQVAEVLVGGFPRGNGRS